MAKNETESATVALLKKGGKKQTKAKGGKAAELDVIQQTVNLVENLTEAKATEVAHSLLDEAESNLFTLGGVFDAIYTHAWHSGYDAFKDYIEDNFGMKIRKAMYLMKIYNDLVASEVAWEKVAKLGWTKLRIISGELTNDNVDDWVKRATAMTTLQLQEYIKGLHSGEIKEGDPEETPSTITTMTFKVHADQKETILEAVETAKGAAETEFDAVALEMICLDYLAGSTGTGKKTKKGKTPSLKDVIKSHSIEDVLNMVEKVFPDVEISATLP